MISVKFRQNGSKIPVIKSYGGYDTSAVGVTTSKNPKKPIMKPVIHFRPEDSREKALNVTLESFEDAVRLILEGTENNNFDLTNYKHEISESSNNFTIKSSQETKDLYNEAYDKVKDEQKKSAPSM
ncbi:MAG: hypothetical protein ACOCRX_06860 [Candidatus Woesearchaeota archaeon]